MKLSLRVQAALIFALVAAVPAVIVAAVLLDINRGAVITAERLLQASVTRELDIVSSNLLRRAKDDTLQLASALSAADDDLSNVRDLLGSRSTVGAFRFFVPSAGVNTVLRQVGTSKGVPSLALDKLISLTTDGIGVALGPQGEVLVASRVEAASGVDAFVTARVVAEEFRAAIEESAQLSFASRSAADETVTPGGGDAKILMVNGDLITIAASQPLGLDAGDSAAELEVVRHFETELHPGLGKVTTINTKDGPMVGSFAGLSGVDWFVMVWRAESEAYSVVRKMRISGVLALLGSLLVALLLGVLAARVVTVPVLQMVRRTRALGGRRWDEAKPKRHRNDELGELSRSLETMADGLQTGEKQLASELKLRADLSRFMGQKLVDSVVSGEHSVELGGKRAEVSVLFADVVAFTPLAESREAEEVVVLLNELFSLLSEIIFRHEGVVDKFIGDCIMGVWGAPISQPDHRRRAVTAARDMMQFLESANEEWLERYGVRIRLAIGINSGDAIVGNVGSSKRMEYTVVGDVVNVAARLEGMAKPGQVLMTRQTQAGIETEFRFRFLGEKNVTGRSRAEKLYELERDE